MDERIQKTGCFTSLWRWLRLRISERVYSGICIQFLDELPKEFCRKDYLTVANKLGIPDKTAEKHIKRFAINGLINHFAHDKYKKL